MQENINAKFVDIRSLRYGEAPVPLLPTSLRSVWQDEPLPNWLIVECKMPLNATIDALGPHFWDWQDHISPRLQHFVDFLVKSRLKNIGAIPVFKRPWPVGLEINDIPFSTRAINALSSSGLIADKDALVKVTFDQLIAFPRIGIRSLIEIATLIEVALDMHWRVTAELARSFATSSDLTTYATTAIESEEVRKGGGAAEGWKETLSAALQNPWIDQIGERDPRFSKLLPPGFGTLEERIDRAISDPAAHSTEIPALLESMPRIEVAIERMAGQSLEDNLLELLTLYIGREEPRISTFAARLGWLGDDPKTLQECGNMLGVTRERIRQIEYKLVKRLSATSLYLPKLDAALATLEAAAPIYVQRASALLVEHGLCKRPFSPISLIDTAKIFGRKTSLAITEHKGERIVVCGEQGRAFGVLSRTARKLAGQSGVASVYQVADMIRESFAPQDSPDIDEDDVRRILCDQPGYEFLDADWFWYSAIPEGRNRLENIIKKILSVASPQSVASIREGVRRQFRWRAASNQRYRSLTVPPQAVLIKFLEKHPDFHLDGEFASSVKHLDYRKLLGEGEQVLVDVLRSISSGVLDRQTLIKECLARGINENTLSVYTSYSSILEHLGIDLWQLRGVKVDPSSVEAVRQQNALRPRETRVQDFGWSPDGKLWVSWTLPRNTSSHVFGIPAPIKRFLAGQSFEAQPKDVDRQIGRIAITDAGMSHGYAPFLRYSGADEGDSLRAEFDIASAKVRLSLNEEIEEELR